MTLQEYYSKNYDFRHANRVFVNIISKSFDNLFTTLINVDNIDGKKVFFDKDIKIERDILKANPNFTYTSFLEKAEIIIVKDKSSIKPYLGVWSKPNNSQIKLSDYLLNNPTKKIMYLEDYNKKYTNIIKGQEPLNHNFCEQLNQVVKDKNYAAGLSFLLNLDISNMSSLLKDKIWTYCREYIIKPCPKLIGHKTIINQLETKFESKKRNHYYGDGYGHLTLSLIADNNTERFLFELPYIAAFNLHLNPSSLKTILDYEKR